MTMPTRLRPLRFMRRLQHRQDGVAAVEFALIAPVLVLLFFGTVELSNLLIADSKLRNVAAGLSDLITQKSNALINTNDLNIANLAASQIMMPLPVTGPRLTVLVTNFRPESTSTSRVVWTRLLVGGAANPQQGTSMGLTTPACSDSSLPASLLPKTATSPFNDVVRVTASYDFEPWFANIFSGTIRLTSTNYNMPRYSLVLNPDPDLSPPC